MTDKSKSKIERIKQCKKDFPQTFKVHEGGGKEYVVDYYPKILRKKYINS